MVIDWIHGLIGGLLIGGGAAVMLIGNGRIAGISGILGSVLGGALHRRGVPEGLAFLAGLIAVPALWSAFASAPEIQVTGSAPLLLVGGLLVGFGTRLGSGCTSGHGVCGLSRLSVRSMAATGVFMAVAAAVVFLTRHLLGGV